MNLLDKLWDEYVSACEKLTSGMAVVLFRLLNLFAEIAHGIGTVVIWASTLWVSVWHHVGARFCRKCRWRYFPALMDLEVEPCEKHEHLFRML